MVAVTNVCNAPSCGAGTGNVVFYAPNSTTPCKTVTDAVNFGTVFFDAFDEKGNLYLTGTGGSSGNVGVIKGGCQAKIIRLLTVSQTLAYQTSVKIDRRDRIAITGSNGSIYAIVTYKLPKNGALGNPVSTTPLDSSVTYPSDFAFTALGRRLYEVNPFNPATVYKYDYPAGGTAEQTLNVGGQPFGIAVSPAMRP